MNLGVWMCIVCVPFYFLLALFFGLLKEKSAVFISGFNTLSKNQQCLYNRAAMAKDMRNMFLLWTAVMSAGAVGSYVVSGYIAIAAYGVWLVSLFRNVHLDAHKAFEKYLL